VKIARIVQTVARRLNVSITQKFSMVELVKLCPDLTLDDFSGLFKGHESENRT